MKIAILSPIFQCAEPSYSLWLVIADQARLLERAGHEVAVLVAENYDERCSPFDPQCCLPPPFQPENLSVRVTESLTKALPYFDVVLTHDWLRMERLRPYLEGMQAYTATESKLRWYHWIHSVPSPRSSWWDMSTLPANHKLVYPINISLEKAAAAFRVGRERAVFIPHPVDLRTRLNFSRLLWKFTNALPGLVDAEITQVYPAGAERLSTKGVAHLIFLFAALKRAGRSVCCFVVDSYSGRMIRQDTSKYLEIAKGCGLEPGEFTFASQISPGFMSMTCEEVIKLQTLSSMFAFPTYGEAYGLVYGEAAALGCFMVPNADCPGLAQICDYGQSVEFGSFESGTIQKDQAFYDRSAASILEAMDANETVQQRSDIRRELNLDVVYRRFYQPLIEGAA